MDSFKEWLIVEAEDLAREMMRGFPGMKRVLMSLGIAPSSLIYLSQGDKGSAFGAGSKIVKITEDEREARSSFHIMGKSIPGVNKIHYVGRFSKSMAYKDLYDESPIDTQYYLIVQERLDTTSVTAKEKAAADAVGDYVTVNWIPKNIDYRVVCNRVIKASGNASALADPESRGMIDALLKTYSRLRRQGVDFLDISGDNIGKDSQGNIRFFDLGVSKSPTNPSMPEIR